MQFRVIILQSMQVDKLVLIDQPISQTVHFTENIE